MADVNLILEAIASQWMLLALIIAGVFAILPWIGLFAINFLNHNIMKEIRSTFNKKVVRVIRIMQNGQLQILYRKMNPDKSITVSENLDRGESDIINPNTAPHPDSDSFKQNYVCVEGQEGTINILEKTSFDVNTPQKKMAISMAFESGREFERYSTLGFDKTPLFKFAVGGIVLVASIILIAMIYTQSTIIEEINNRIESVQSPISAIYNEVVPQEIAPPQDYEPPEITPEG